MTDRHVKAKQCEKEKKNEMHIRLKFKLAPSSAFSLPNVLHIFGKISYAKNNSITWFTCRGNERNHCGPWGIPLQGSQ